MIEKEILKENESLKYEICKLKKELLKKKIALDIKQNHMNRIVELNNLLNTKLEIKDISKLLFTYLKKIFYFDIGTIIIKKDNKKFIYQAILKNNKQIFKNINNERNFISYLTKKIFVSNKTIFYKNIKKNPEFRKEDIDFISTQACCAIPINYQGKVNGVIIFESKTANIYSQTEINFIENLLNEISFILISGMQFSKINELFSKDKLTMLSSRKYFFDILNNYIKTTQNTKNSFAVILIDIDYFKDINEQFGHLLGDKILKRISANLKDTIRTNDIIARYGGEEFVLLLPNTKLQTAKIIAERLRKRIEFSPIFNLKITASFGIAMYETNSQDTDIIDKADMALYEAKKKGKNKVIVFKENKNSA